jgi:hypothetical protein
VHDTEVEDADGVMMQALGSVSVQEPHVLIPLRDRTEFAALMPSRHTLTNKFIEPRPAAAGAMKKELLRGESSELLKEIQKISNKGVIIF